MPFFPSRHRRKSSTLRPTIWWKEKLFFFFAPKCRLYECPKHVTSLYYLQLRAQPSVQQQAQFGGKKVTFFLCAKMLTTWKCKNWKEFVLSESSNSTITVTTSSFCSIRDSNKILTIVGEVSIWKCSLWILVQNFEAKSSRQSYFF